MDYNEDARVAWEGGAAGREGRKNQSRRQRYKNMSADEKPQIKARRRELEADGSDLKAYTLAKKNLRSAMSTSTDVDRIADRLRDVDSAKFVLTLMTEDSKKPWAPRNRKRSSKVLSEQALASAERIVSAAPKRQRRRGVVSC